jgi:hypothetical protein
MNAEQVRVVVVMPVGPGDDSADSIRSVLHYLGPSRAVVVIDDTRDPGRRDGMEELGPEVHVVPSSGERGKQGGLFLKLAAGYRYALGRFDFDVLLRMDADALVIGPRPEEDAIRAFSSRPGTGLLGSFRVRTDGVARDMAPAARLLRHEAGWLGIGRPARRRMLRGWLREARANGYADGDHVLGGAYFHRRACVDDIARRGWLERAPLAPSALGEDHLMSLLTVAAGWRIGDFGGPEDILALRWHGLPMHPDELLRRRKKITHSVRAWADMEEQEIRATFAAARGSGGAG